jgi:hypothetical protein
VAARLYWFRVSHPAQSAGAMLDLKGVDYELATVLPGMQRVHLRLVGFRGGTVPALKLDGRRVQGSRRIARALDAFADLHERVAPHPCAAAARRLFPDFPEPVPRYLPPDWIA